MLAVAQVAVTQGGRKELAKVGELGRGMSTLMKNAKENPGLTMPSERAEEWDGKQWDPKTTLDGSFNSPPARRKML